MKKRLLLADDSVTIQKVVQITFSHDDYELTVVDNGDIAYEKARLQRPDLVLADVFMPGKNGYELCSAIKGDSSLATVPVLLLTGTFEPFDEAKARAAGADRWIAKPFESQALISCVEELLKQAVQAPAVAPQVTIPPPSPVPVESFTPAPSVSPVIETVDDMWGSDIVIEDDFASVEQPVADPFAATSQDDLWDVSGFETDTPVSSAAEDIWAGGFDDLATVVVPAPVSPATMTVEDSWGADDFSTAFADADEVAPNLISASVTEIPLADEVEVLDESDLLEPLAVSSPEVDLTDVLSVEDFSFAEEAEETVMIKPSEPLPPVTPAHVVASAVERVALDVAPAVISETVSGVSALSDTQLDLIVERVAGVVISRLSESLLEKIVWEVVPDLAETMIKEELRRIRESVTVD